MNDIKFAKYRKQKGCITKDGHAMHDQDVVANLNRKSFLEGLVLELHERRGKFRLAISNMATDGLKQQERIAELEAALLVIANSNALTIKERLDIGGNGITAYYAQMAANALNGQWSETK